MKVFIFNKVEQLTDRYHSDGGLVIVAKSKEEAEEIIKQEPYLEVTNEEWEEVQVYDLKDDCDSRLFIFPDAGCC